MSASASAHTSKRAAGRPSSASISPCACHQTAST
jgi:hypothetical protein